MHTFFLRLARAMAWVGGLTLAALVVMTCVSILGRTVNGWLHSDLIEGIAPGVARWLLDLGIGPVNGDFELIEAGMGFAIFAFLPLCQMTGSHASVDIFVSRLSARTQKGMQWVAEVLFAGVLILIAVQLAAGLDSKYQSGQTTFLIELPIWWAYAASLVGAVLAAVIAVYLAVMRTFELVLGRDLLPAGEGA